MTTYKSKRHKHNKHTLKIYRGGQASIISNIELLVSIILQGLENASERTIKIFAKFIDPNINTEIPVSQTLNRIKDKLLQISVLLKSPVGQEILKSASDIGEKFIEVGTEPVKKVFNEGIDYAKKQIPVIQDMAKTTLFGMPVIGSAAAAVEDGLDVVQALENTAETTAKMVSHGEEFINKINSPINDAKNLWTKLETNLDNVNQSISNNLNQKMSELQKPLPNLPNVPKLPNVPNINDANKLIQTRKMIGGRIRKAREEFLNSSSFSSNCNKFSCKTRKNYM
jgi:hypothetical protein